MHKKNYKDVKSLVKESKHSAGKEFQSLDELIAVQRRKMLT